MRGSATRKSSFVLAIVGLVGWNSLVAAPVFAQGTTVQVQICQTAYITLEQPQSDSVISQPTVAVAGQVGHASQMEVLVDDQFDSATAIAAGQSTFETNVTLSPGTHTITAKAIDSCSGVPVSDTSVVTYTPTPSTPSSGATTETDMEGGVVVASGDNALSQRPEYGLLPAPIVDGWQRLLEWMNIAPLDTNDEQYSRLSLMGAVLIATGIYMLTIGVGIGILKRVAATPLLERVKKRERVPLLKRIVRWIGGGLIILGLLL